MRRTKTRGVRRPDAAARSRRAKPISDTARQAVVGLGASAGGLAAFESFFRAMPPDSGAAFVVIQHLDPTHQSLTAELLSKHARMPVVQVEHDTPAGPDRVYVIPPNRYLSIDNGTLRLTAPTEPRGMRMPVDLFLRSLARDQKERAVGIILSGTGTDGALGLKEIKAAGGMTIAQAPETAQYDGMPRSAILTAGVDHVLPVDRMPEVVLQYLRHAYVRRGTDEAPALADQAVDDLMPVLAILHARSKFDFRCYKKESLRRRVQRRMSLHHLTRLTDYLRVLRSDPDEVNALRKDLLISVTSFFRDSQAWQALEQHVIPRIVERKDPSHGVRVWVPSCATGEEAYSVAMLLIEQLVAAEKNCVLQIFASDVDTDALEVARAGIYPESIAADVSPERLRRFLVKEGNSYRVHKDLRESVIFAQQNLLSDPPFSKIDLITCRNVLMYLEPATQRKLLGLLHFSLADGGYLFLGTAESIGDQDDLFEPVVKKWHVFRRIGPTRRDKVEFPVTPLLTPATDVPLPAAAGPPLGRITSLAQQAVLERFAPACVVITRRGDILHFSGPTSDYLVQPQGSPTQHLFALAREGLHSRLRGAVHRAIRDDQIVVASATVRRGRTLQRVRLTVEPLTGSTGTNGLLLVAFEDETRASRSRQSLPMDVGDESLVRQLERELKTTRDDLRSTIEQLETANEELKASNEEVMSANEELQSTNEELQTSKEELQSLNEELSTINAQLQAKVDELEQTNNDLDNLLSSTNVATIFLDPSFHIRGFTPAANALFNLISTDVGRPLSDIAQRFTDRELLADAKSVLEQLVPIRKEVKTHDGHWYLRQVLPYRTRDNRIEGVVITFENAAEEVLAEARVRAEAIVDTVREPLLVLDASLRVLSANVPFYRTFETSHELAENRLLDELDDGAWDAPALRDALRRILPDGTPMVDVEVHRDFPRIGQRTMLLNARRLAGRGGQSDLILLAMEDVTERRRQEREIMRGESVIRAIVESAADAIITVDERGSILSFNPGAERIFGYSSDDAIGQPFATLVPSRTTAGGDGEVTHSLGIDTTSGVVSAREVVGRRKAGTTFPAELAVGAYEDGAGRNLVCTVRDITERVRVHEETARHQNELARVLRVATLGELAAGLAHELGQPLAAMANLLEACAAKIRAGNRPRSEVLKLVRQAVTQSLRAGRIVRHVTALVRRGERRVETFDIRRLIDLDAGLVSAELAHHSITLRLELGDAALPVHACRVEIEQVILNLAQNAVDAIVRKDGARREIVLRTSRGTGETAQVAVIDSGGGIPYSVTSRMFEPFFSTKHDGLGMGLAICRSIVEAHGGRLWLAPDQSAAGTAICFALPLAPRRRVRRPDAAKNRR